MQVVILTWFMFDYHAAEADFWLASFVTTWMTIWISLTCYHVCYSKLDNCLWMSIKIQKLCRSWYLIPNFIQSHRWPKRNNRRFGKPTWMQEQTGQWRWDSLISSTTTITTCQCTPNLAWSKLQNKLSFCHVYITVTQWLLNLCNTIEH